MSDYLSPSNVALAYGVSESSVRRWVDQGRIQSVRTAGGHRKILRREALRFARENRFELARSDLLLERDLGATRNTKSADPSELLYEALVAGRSAEFSSRVVGLYLAGSSVAEICDEPLRQALGRIGELWPEDSKGILIEHRATTICMDTLNRLRDQLPPCSESASIAVGGAPESDPYLLPSLMAATVLEDSGWQVINLGPNSPLPVLVDAALEMNARLLWISCTAGVPKAPFERSLQRLSVALPDASILLGGRTAGRYRLDGLSNVHCLSSLVELSGFARGQAGGP